MNIELQKDFEQVCVWPGTVVGKEKIEDFERFIDDIFKTRIQYLEEISTFPDTDSSGKVVPETGGRNDVFFAIHNEDVGKFAVPRLQYGIRWIEDVLAEGNYTSKIYPTRVFDYCCWNKEHLAE